MDAVTAQPVQGSSAPKRWRPLWPVALGLALLTGCSDGTYNSQTLAAQGIYTGTLSAQGDYALIGSMNHGGSLWQTAGHERLFNWNHSGAGFSDLNASGFSPDGTKAVTAEPRSLVVWDTRSGKDLAFWGSPSNVMDVALGNTGRALLLGMQDHSALLIDPTNGNLLHSLEHKGAVGSVARTHNLSHALTGSDDETAVLWDLTTGNAELTLQHTNPVRVVALSASGAFIFTAAQGREVSLWDASNGELVNLLQERNTGVLSAEFSADEALLLVGYVNRRVQLWSTRSRRQLGEWHIAPENTLRTQGGAVLALSFAADPGVYFALTGDGRLSELRGGSPQ